MGNNINIQAPDQVSVAITSRVIQNQGVPAGAGNKFDSFYSYSFTSSAWIASGDEYYLEISHNLDKHAACTVVDSLDNVVVPSIEYISSNVVRIYTSAQFSGKAYFN